MDTKVPTYVVTIEAVQAPAAHLTAAGERALADELRLVHGLRQAWQLLKRLSRAVAWRAGRVVGSLRRRIRVSYRARCRPGRRAAG